MTGTYICKAGRTTGKTCGGINQVNVTQDVCEIDGSHCVTYTAQFGADLCSQGGDSGGAMYSVNAADTGGLAYGIVSSSSTYWSCSSSSETFSSTMPNIMNDLGVSITVGTAPSSRETTFL